MVTVGGLNLAGGLDPVHNAIDVAELATEKGATTLLIPISAPAPAVRPVGRDGDEADRDLLRRRTRH